MTSSETPAPSSVAVRPGTPEAFRLFNECRSLARSYLAESIQQLFQKSDDTLFDFAEKSSSDDGNSRYFDAMRTMRLKKEEIVRLFLDHIERGFTRFLPQANQEAAVAIGSGAVTLSLLDESELEESLAIQAMAEKVESALATDLSHLRQRWAKLLGLSELSAREDPVGPLQLGEAYRESLRVLDAGIEVRLVLYKLFDKFLLSHTEDLYGDLNRLLAKHGLMPEFKVKPRPERARPEKRISSEHDSHREAEEGDGRVAADGELLPLLRELLTQQRGGGGGGGGGGAAGAASGAPLVVPEPQVVMAALTALQHQVSLLSSEGAAPVSPEAVRTALKEQFQRGGQASGAGLSSQDNDLIDLISMLFEFILDDRALPDNVRVLLARLQIPMLKVALADRSFFSQTRHPARRLLNMLAKAGIGLDDTLVPENSPRLAEIQRIVGRIIENLTDDLGLFETLAAEFEAFLAKEGEKEQAVAKKQTVALRTREAREQIRIAVHNKLDELVAGRTIPERVEQLLRGPWTEVLIETRLRNEQTTWATRTALLRDMILSVTAKSTREARLALPPIIARVVVTLREGLSSIGYSAERIDEIVAELEPYHLAVASGKPLPSDAVTEPEAAEKETAASSKPPNPLDDMIAQMKAQMEAVAEQEKLGHLFAEEAPTTAEETLEAEEEEGDKEPPPPEEFMQLARAYEIGTWFTFSAPDGSKRRAKLTWKSNLLDECIFLDWRMKLVASINMTQFARMLHEGTVAELRDTPLFDRAMDALMGRLKTGQRDKR